LAASQVASDLVFIPGGIIMTNKLITTIAEFVPDITSQLILKEAMSKSFPQDREKIEPQLQAFAVAQVRFSRVDVDTKSLQRYFRNECGWNEFQAMWYKSRIDEALIVAKTIKRLGGYGE
jgi:hypothetical protein